ncbi:MAG: insulinase family protein [Myxococcota bacterium]
MLRLSVALACVLAGACKQSTPPAADASVVTAQTAPDVVASPPADAVAAPEADAVAAPADAAPATEPDAAPQAPIDDDAPLGLWPAVEKGKLANGLTYYIKKHGTPAKRASMWLAVNAGSLLEDDDQRGLAHFCEHMAFNGTKGFERSAIVDYLEKIGMRFGADLNAFTSYDETVYQLLVPTDDQAFLDKGLSILREWASEVSYDPAEVEKERGVVLEEWRLGRGPGERLGKLQRPVLFAGSRYAERDPIGLPEIIKGASRDALVRFYHDWYRPDLMAVIVVGDLDPAWVKAEIERRFGDLKNPDNERPRVRAEVPKGGGTRVSIETDPEASSSSVTVYDLTAHRRESTGNDLRRSIVEQVYQNALDARFEILGRKPDAPFTRAGVGAQGLMREIDAFARSAVVKSDREAAQIEETLRSLFTEVLRVERHGFSAAELERAKADVSRMYDEYVADEGTADGSEYAAEMTRNFFEGELMVGRVAEAAAAHRFLPLVTVDELDAVAKGFGGADNRVVVIDGHDPKVMPTKDRVMAIIAEVEKSDIPAWQDSGPAKPLMAAPPAPGKVVAEATIDAIGVTQWTLSNGAKVLVKPTDFEADHFQMVGSSPGGLATAAAADVITARNAESVLGVGGVGALDATGVDQALAGKSASGTTWVDQTREGVSASGAPGDLETALQLVYLHMTAPRRDDTAIGVWKQGFEQAIVNGLKNPAVRFERELADDMYAKHPLVRSLDPADVEAVSVERALAFHQDRFGDASDFTFVFVGALDLAKLKPLVETYLASLPAAGRKESEIDPGVHLPPGRVEKTWHLGQEPKASVQLTFHGDETWSRDKERDMYILSQVLDLRLHQTLREDMSGTYNVSAGGAVTRRPRQERVLTIHFGCAPENVDKLLAATMTELKALAEKGPTADELEKVRQEFVRGREADLRQNSFWLSWLALNDRFGDDPTRILDPSGVLARMTIEHVKEAAARNLDASGLYQAILLPAAK